MQPPPPTHFQSPPNQFLSPSPCSNPTQPPFSSITFEIRTPTLYPLPPPLNFINPAPLSSSTSKIQSPTFLLFISFSIPDHHHLRRQTSHSASSHPSRLLPPLPPPIVLRFPLPPLLRTRPPLPRSAPSPQLRIPTRTRYGPLQMQVLPQARQADIRADFDSDSARNNEEEFVELKPEVVDFPRFHYRMVHQLEKKYFPEQSLDKAFVDQNAKSEVKERKGKKKKGKVEEERDERVLMFFDEGEKEKGGVVLTQGYFWNHNTSG